MYLTPKTNLLTYEARLDFANSVRFMRWNDKCLIRIYFLIIMLLGAKILISASNASQIYLLMGVYITVEGCVKYLRDFRESIMC